MVTPLLSLNISETAKDTAIVATDAVQEPFSMTLLTLNPDFKVTIFYNVK